METYQTYHQTYRTVSFSGLRDGLLIINDHHRFTTLQRFLGHGSWEIALITSKVTQAPGKQRFQPLGWPVRQSERGVIENRDSAARYGNFHSDKLLDLGRFLKFEDKSIFAQLAVQYH